MLLIPKTFEPLLQEYVPPPLAVKVIEVLIQFNKVIGEIIVGLGGVKFCVIDWIAVEVHPFALVTVTVYVPGVLTESVAFVPTNIEPLDHE